MDKSISRMHLCVLAIRIILNNYVELDASSNFIAESAILNVGIGEKDPDYYFLHSLN